MTGSAHNCTQIILLNGAALCTQIHRDQIFAASKSPCRFRQGLSCYVCGFSGQWGLILRFCAFCPPREPPQLRQIPEPESPVQAQVRCHRSEARRALQAAASPGSCCPSPPERGCRSSSALRCSSHPPQHPSAVLPSALTL